jgi:hypothetical protein
MFSALYTKHLTQKRKIYQDGFLKVRNSSLTLLDDSRKLVDTTTFVGPLVEGTEIKFDRFLVEVGAPVDSAAGGQALPAPATDLVRPEPTRTAPMKKRPFTAPSQAGRAKRVNVGGEDRSSVVDERKNTTLDSRASFDTTLAQTTCSSVDQRIDTAVTQHNSVLDELDDNLLPSSNVLSVPRSNDDLLAAILGATTSSNSAFAAPTDNRHGVSSSATALVPIRRAVVDSQPARAAVAPQRVGLKAPALAGKFTPPVSDNSFRWYVARACVSNS